MKIILMVLLTMISVAGLSQDTIVCGCPMEDHPSMMYRLPSGMSICACEPSGLVFGTDITEYLLVDTSIVRKWINPTATFKGGFDGSSAAPLHFTKHEGGVFPVQPESGQIEDNSTLFFNNPPVVRKKEEILDGSTRITLVNITTGKEAEALFEIENGCATK